MAFNPVEVAYSTMEFPDEDRREISRIVREWMSEADVPGASVAITDDEGTAYADGFGSRDLATYLRYQLSGGTDPELVDPGLLARAHEGHVETPAGPYGYGCRTREVAGERLVGHGGSIGVATAYAGFLPEHDLGVAIACNVGARPHPTQVAEAIVATLAGEDPADAVPHYRYRHRIDPLEGEYEAYAGLRTATIEERAGVLELGIATAVDERTLVLVPEDLEEWRFRIRTRGGREAPVEFVETDDGIDLFVERLRLHQT